jgi:uncharacterized membrane protein YdcZ (DUF606 family)
MKTRLWIESGLAVLSGLFFLLTLAWNEWIEEVFRFDPDSGSGAAEWLIVGGLCASTLLFISLARRERRSMVRSARFA